MNEVVAWQTGVDWARTHEALETLLAQPGEVIYRSIGRASRDSLEAIGFRVWSHWVRQGYADATREQRQ